MKADLEFCYDQFHRENCTVLYICKFCCNVAFCSQTENQMIIHLRDFHKIDVDVIIKI